MDSELFAKFRKWYDLHNRPISIMEPCKESYEEGFKEGRIDIATKISNCVTYEEIMYLIRIELD
jgi:hypothetical protein